mmetsp:Transcript_5264/g.8280  ORF Transcript_5264/g.8280 Transcript_5264/m.8280 type:complete len:97 (-) Transcript_5264:106-396(-)
MHDLSSRCFVGILTPQPSSPPSNISTNKYDPASTSDSSHHGDHVSSSDALEDEHKDKEVIPIDKKTHHHETKARLPCGRMLRLYDDLLCKLIFDPE